MLSPNIFRNIPNTRYTNEGLIPTVNYIELWVQQYRRGYTGTFLSISPIDEMVFGIKIFFHSRSY